MAELTERPIEEYLLAQCRSRGFLCLKFTSPARAGVPDRLLVTPAATVFVEVKRPGGIPRRLQRVMHAKIRRFGGVVHTVDTLAGVDALLDQLAQPPQTPVARGPETTTPSGSRPDAARPLSLGQRQQRQQRQGLPLHDPHRRPR